MAEQRTRTEYGSLTQAQRTGYVAAVIAFVVFTLFTAIVFGPVM